MSKTIQRVLIQHRNCVLLPAKMGDGDASAESIVAFARNLEKLGYRLSKELFTAVQGFGQNEFNEWAADVIKDTKDLKGASFKYAPMYPNFPKQVAEASEVELYLNAIVHYIGDLIGLRIMPEYEKVDRKKLKTNKSKFTSLNVVSYENKEAVLSSLFVNLVTSKVALSAGVKDDLALVAFNLDTIPVISKIEVKENLALYAGIIRKSPTTLSATLRSLSNPTDLLRIAAVFGGSDPALSESVNFGKLSRAERRAFLAALDSFGEDKLVSAFKRNVQLWKKFTKHIHAGEYALAYPVAYSAINALRSSRLVDPFNAAVENAILSRNLEESLQLLSRRPSVLVRRLYELLTVFPENTDAILTSVSKVASKASSQVLAQAYGRFTSESNSKRVVFSRSVTKAPAVINGSQYLTESVSAEAAEMLRAALVENFRERGSLGKVYLAEPTGSHAIPFGFRSASDSFKLLGRGSALPFNTDDTLRFFLHWKDLDEFSRVDVDLSAVLLDENMRMLDRISYYNLKGFGGVHSGDITSAPNGAAEFIDLVPSKVIKQVKNARYVAMSVIVYYGPSFDQIPEALAGFMVRSGNAQRGEIFDARTVENAYKVNSSSKHSVPFIFDLVEGKAIWVDLATSAEAAAQNVDNTSKTTTSLLKAVTSRNFLSVETLLKLHAEARASELVESAEEADVVLDYNAFTFDEILADWI